MTITLHSTNKTISLNAVPVRVWEGHTASGIPVEAYITRLGVDKQDAPAFRQEMGTDLEDASAPQLVDLRLLI